MRFYRVQTWCEGGISGGIEWYTNKREAERSAREANNEETGGIPVEVEEVDIEPTKLGILRALRRWASHPDNG